MHRQRDVEKELPDPSKTIVLNTTLDGHTIGKHIGKLSVEGNHKFMKGVLKNGTIHDPSSLDLYSHLNPRANTVLPIVSTRSMRNTWSYLAEDPSLLNSFVKVKQEEIKRFVRRVNSYTRDPVLRDGDVNGNAEKTLIRDLIRTNGLDEEVQHMLKMKVVSKNSLRMDLPDELKRHVEEFRASDSGGFRTRKRRKRRKTR